MRTPQFLLNAADRADLAVEGHRAGASDRLAPGHIARGQAVNDAKGEHHAGARAAHAFQVEGDVNGQGGVDGQVDAELRTRLGCGDGDRVERQVLGDAIALDRDRHEAPRGHGSHECEGRGGACNVVARTVGGRDRQQDIAFLDDTLRVGSFRRARNRYSRRDVPAEVLEGRDLGGRLRVTHHGGLRVAHLVLGGSSGIDRLVIDNLGMRVEVGTHQLSKVQTVSGATRLGDRDHAQLALSGLRLGGDRRRLGVVKLHLLPRRGVSALDGDHRFTVGGTQHVKGRPGAGNHEGSGHPEEDHRHRNQSDEGRRQPPAHKRGVPFTVPVLKGERVVMCRGHLGFIHCAIVSHRRLTRTPTPYALSVFAGFCQPGSTPTR